MIKAKYETNTKDVFCIIVSIMLFLLSINFMNKFNYILMIIFFTIMINMLLKNRFIGITKELIILHLCFTTYFIIYINYYQITMHSLIVYWIGPPIAYFIGYHLIDELNNKNIKLSIFSIVIGLFLHGFINMILFFQRGIKTRVIPDIWLNFDIAATLQSIFFTLICSLLFYALFICKNIICKSIYILCILFSIYSVMETASRTLIVILVLTLSINIILYLYLNKDKRYKILKLILYSIVLLISALIIYKFNIFNIQHIYKQSALYERVHYELGMNQLNEDPRFEMFKISFLNMLDYPFGGNKTLEISYAHNLWLDVAKVAGIIPFILLVIYTIMTTITIVRFIIYKNISSEYKYIIISIYSSLIINFMVEPILEGMPTIFIIMCIFNGMTKRLLKISSIRRITYE